jgi:hypothetical protein
MHRVCAASRGSQVTGLQGHSDRQNTSKLMSDSILVTWAACLAIYSYLLLSAGCWCYLPAQGCAACTQGYRLQGMSDCVNTREQAGIRALPCCAKAVQGKLVSCSCLQQFALPDAQGLQHVNTASCRLHCMLDQ